MRVAQAKSDRFFQEDSGMSPSVKSKNSDLNYSHLDDHGDMDGGVGVEIEEGDALMRVQHEPVDHHRAGVPLISMRVGLFWLLVITLCISAMSDIIVDCIDGFAQRMQLSQVFTSMVIVPFFSNVAEQVSAFIFAWRNEMDLVVGVTIGSAIQIATFVLPGSVLIGYVLDRSMTLYFHTYETACLFFCTVVAASVLQSGTTNWFVGANLVGIYVMLAAGIWYHETENLSIDAEDVIHEIEGLGGN
jgi:calcium/proton exchanger cax